MQLHTNRYQRFNPRQGLAVRTTVGLPKFRLGYPLDHHARLITPERWMLSLGHDEYVDAYTARLNRAGLSAIRKELNAIAKAGRKQQLVLLCFDDLHAPDGWCHRTMFAAWWKEQTGEEVRELDDTPPSRPAGAPAPDPTLF